MAAIRAGLPQRWQRATRGRAHLVASARETDPGPVYRCNHPVDFCKRHRGEKEFSVRTFTSRAAAASVRAGRPSKQLDDGLKVKITAVRKFSNDVDREIQEGRSLLIGCPPGRERDTPVYVMLTPRVLPMK